MWIPRISVLLSLIIQIFGQQPPTPIPIPQNIKSFRQIQNSNYRIFDGTPIPIRWPVVFAVTPGTPPPGWPSDSNRLAYVWTFQGSDQICTYAGIPRQNPCTGRVIEKTWLQPGTFEVSVNVINPSTNEYFAITQKIMIVPGLNSKKATVRREFRDMPYGQWQRLIEAFKTLKGIGVWDHLSWIHGNTFFNSTGAGRTAAHSSPAFLPWHRGYLRIFERLVQKLLRDDEIGLPYWDWTIDTANSSSIVPPNMPLFTDRYVGGNGDSSKDNAILNGPFCGVPGCGGNWTIASDFNMGLMIKRDIGNDGTLPTRLAWEEMLKVLEYDRPPFGNNWKGFEQQLNGQPFVPSFRGILEGWAPNPWGDFHNGVHRWFGGTMANVEFSIQDPVFLLHHANVDRTFTLWQQAHSCFSQSCYHPQLSDLTNNMPGVQETANGLQIPGQMFNNDMHPWLFTIADVWTGDGVLGEYRYAVPGEQAPPTSPPPPIGDGSHNNRTSTRKSSTSARAKVSASISFVIYAALVLYMRVYV